jgi:predicted phosphoribosyltransferase
MMAKAGESVPFKDRRDAGRRLAERLDDVRDDLPVVLGLPRGGVLVADEVARALDAPLDVIVVRKLGVPHQPELAMGAIAEDGVEVLNEPLGLSLGVTVEETANAIARERVELERRARLYRDDEPRIAVAGRTVIVVDDGVATGSSARAACRVARALGAARVVLAVPVAPVGWEHEIGGDADEFRCLETPNPFHAVGQFYLDFDQTNDDEVIKCLERSRSGPHP